MEPNDYEEPSPLRIRGSESIDLVPALLDQARGRLTWIEPYVIEEWGVTPKDLEATANENMTNTPEESSILRAGHDAGRPACFETKLPFKAPLLFTPNLKAKVAREIGWPIHAVLPDRDFVFIWPANAPSTIQQVSAGVLEEFESTGYPLTLEVLEFEDSACNAIGRIATIATVPTVVAAITDVFFLAKVHDAIKAAGGEMKLARTANEAVEHARAGASLLLLDLNDRAFAALDLARTMRADEQLKTVPVVGFLSHVQTDLKQQAVATGINEVLARSVFSSSLPSVLRRYIG